MNINEENFEASLNASDYAPEIRNIIKGFRQASLPEINAASKPTPEERLRARSAILTLLTAATLQYAQQYVPYYKQYFSTIGFSRNRFSNLTDLELLDVIERKDVCAHYQSMLNPAVTCAGMRSTGGTTLIGEMSSTQAKFRMVIPYCLEEMYFTALLRNSARVLAPEDRKPLVLLVQFPQRRVGSTGLPFESHLVVQAPLVLDFPRYFNRHDYFDHVATMLFTEFKVPGVNSCFTEVTFLPAFLLRLFTEEALRRKIELREAPIKRILCAGDQVTVSELADLERKWEKPIHLTYGFSESHGIAVGCPIHRDRYHFDFAQYIEVLDPTTHKPVAVGQDGLLVVTTLYPFHMAMPFIRYSVGDVVQLHEDLCDCGFVGQVVSVVGRFGQCVALSSAPRDEGGRRFLGTNDLVSIFDRLGAFPKSMHYKFKAEAIRQSSSLVIRIRIESGPYVSEARNSVIRQKISDEITRINPSWRAAVEAGKLSFEILFHDVGDTMDYFFLGT